MHLYSDLSGKMPAFMGGLKIREVTWKIGTTMKLCTERKERKRREGKREGKGRAKGREEEREEGGEGNREGKREGKGREGKREGRNGGRERERKIYITNLDCWRTQSFW